MSLPLRCPICRQYDLALDRSLDHQHITCECGASFCAVCVGVMFVSLASAEASRMAKAHLN